MSDQLENMDLSCDSLDIGNLTYSIFFEDFDRNLNYQTGTVNKSLRKTQKVMTFSPVIVCMPSFTFPKVPSPIDFPTQVG